MSQYRSRWRERYETRLVLLLTVQHLGIDWLSQFESLWEISAIANGCKEFESSLRNIILEILLDQDNALVDALNYCLKLTKVVNR